MTGDDSERAPYRRRFLRGAAWTAAGLAVGTAAGVGIGSLVGTSTPRKTDLPERSGGAGFDHLVVLMFENRSFDNLLGYLYSSQGFPLPAGQVFDGLEGTPKTNTAPDGTVVSAHPYSGPTDAVMSSPNPNAGEEYPHINTQLFGVVDPPENATAKVGSMRAPFNAPPTGARPTMSGFVEDYINAYRVHHQGVEPTPEQYGVIMGSFTPSMLPVFSTLAKDFAVYDHWFSAVPSQTFCNRSFFHASTSHGFVDNKGKLGFAKWIDPQRNTAPTIFNRLEDAGIRWAVYFDESQLVSLTGLIHAPQLEPYWKTNFRTMKQFHEDAAAGTLPAYSFIEPRMIYNHNDMHPPVGAMTAAEVDGKTVVGGGVSDARAGDALLHEVYESVRTSASHDGSNALNTMLLVTFDETGGTFDHVPPPAAAPPGDSASSPGEFGFGFDRLGVRVPTIAISAYTPAGTVINQRMHHGAVIGTLCEKYDLPPLTERDRQTRTLATATTGTSPRQPSTWPVTTAHYVPPNPEATAPATGASGGPALSPPAVALLSILLAKYGQPGDPLPKTYTDAHELLEKHGRQLFG
ncbi:alkaline phosphatase family protein [Lacisediminihabitans sp.]|uniref:alkaline phosphatase family protein n=1 Tax=Lacisediminihabitans sp. TaxID=2787631 RepID=UPI00374DCA70